MALAYAGERAAGTSASTSSVAITLASDCTAGSRVVLGFGGRNTADSTVSVTDSKSNTWLIDAGPIRESGNAYGFVASTGMNLATLLTGDVITVSIGGTPSCAMFYVEEISGVSSAALDVTVTNSATTGTTASTGTSAATVQNDEFVVNFFFADDEAGVWTVGGGYTQFTTLNQENTGKTSAGQYKIVAATGTQSGSMAFSGISEGWVGLLATYKQAAAGGAVAPQRRRMGMGS